MLEKRYIGTIQRFDHEIDSAQKLVIYGAGTYGKLLVDYLIDGGRADQICGIVVTNFRKDDVSDYRGVRIREASQFFTENPEYCGALVVVAIMQREYKYEVVRHLSQLGIGSCLLCTDSVMDSWIVKRDERKRAAYKGLDFLAAGFMKCGTTSFHMALQSVRDVYLPAQKETLYFEWAAKVKNPMDELIHRFFSNIREGQKAGLIDPTFGDKPAQIYETFGGDTKICLLMRNPVDADFSRYKMGIRQGDIYIMNEQREQGSESVIDTAFRKYRVYSGKIFDAYYDVLRGAACPLFTFQYDVYVEKFLEYYPLNQIKIIFFEEMLLNPQKTINQFLDFIGVNSQFEGGGLPHVNDGNFVWADMDGYQTAKAFYAAQKRAYFQTATLKNEVELKLALLKSETETPAQEKIYGLRLTSDQRQRLEAFYEPSVRRLEKLLKKNLSDLWF